MDTLPLVQVNHTNISSWANKVNHMVHKHKLGTSNDFQISETTYGTHIKLKRKHKPNFISMNYASDYDPNASYNVGDVVRVQAANLSNLKDLDGNAVSVPVGIWVCVWGVPDATFTRNVQNQVASNLWPTIAKFMRQQNTNYYPQLPEPTPMTQLTDGSANGRYWEFIGVLPNYDCAN